MNTSTSVCLALLVACGDDGGGGDSGSGNAGSETGTSADGPGTNGSTDATGLATGSASGTSAGSGTATDGTGGTAESSSSNGGGQCPPCQSQRDCNALPQPQGGYTCINDQCCPNVGPAQCTEENFDQFCG